MTRLFVVPLAKKGSLGCGVRRDPDHLLHLRTRGKTLNRLQAPRQARPDGLISNLRKPQALRIAICLTSRYHYGLMKIPEGACAPEYSGIHAHAALRPDSKTISRVAAQRALLNTIGH